MGVFTVMCIAVKHFNSILEAVKALGSWHLFHHRPWRLERATSYVNFKTWLGKNKSYLFQDSGFLSPGHREKTWAKNTIPSFPRAGIVQCTTAPGWSLIPSSKRWQHRSCLQEPAAAWEWSFVLPGDREKSKGTLIPSDTRISNWASACSEHSVAQDTRKVY